MFYKRQNYPATTMTTQRFNEEDPQQRLVELWAEGGQPVYRNQSLVTRSELEHEQLR